MPDSCDSWTVACSLLLCPWDFPGKHIEISPHFHPHIKVSLIYNVVLVFGIQKSDSVLHICIFSDSFPLHKVITRY